MHALQRRQMHIAAKLQLPWFMSALHRYLYHVEGVATFLARAVWSSVVLVTALADQAEQWTPANMVFRHKRAHEMSPIKHAADPLPAPCSSGLVSLTPTLLPALPPTASAS
jgi:hypothetical protein